MNTSNIESKLSATQLQKLASDAGRVAHDNYPSALENSNNPVAILYRELISQCKSSSMVADEWYETNPELALELRVFLQSEHARLLADARNELMLKYWGHLNYADKV